MTFLWEHLKSKIYSTALISIQECKRTTTAKECGTGKETLKKVEDNTNLRLKFIMKVAEGHIKNMPD